MDDLVFFFQGSVFGIILTLPLGPIALLCIQRTLLFGKMAGIISGMGASCADIVYASLALFGVSLVQVFIYQQQVLFKVIGGIILSFWGIRLIMQRQKEKSIQEKNRTYSNYFISAFILTITNPVVMLAFAALFTATGINTIKMSFFSKTTFLFGLFIGSVLWWIVLNITISWLKPKLVHYQHRINIITGIIFLFVGLGGVFVATVL